MTAETDWRRPRKAHHRAQRFAPPVNRQSNRAARPLAWVRSTALEHLIKLMAPDACSAGSRCRRCAALASEVFQPCFPARGERMSCRSDPWRALSTGPAGALHIGSHQEALPSLGGYAAVEQTRRHGDCRAASASWPAAPHTDGEKHSIQAPSQQTDAPGTTNL